MLPGGRRLCFVLANVPGTVYFGPLIGPYHQVFHEDARPHELIDFPGFGCCSVSVMIRTALFPHFRSRTRKRIPHPKALFALIEKAARDMFLQDTSLLPSLGECLLFASRRDLACDTPVLPSGGAVPGDLAECGLDRREKPERRIFTPPVRKVRRVRLFAKTTLD